MENHKIRMPKYLKWLNDKLKFVNIWGAKKLTKSQWHYDAYLNFNYCIRVKIKLS